MYNRHFFDIPQDFRFPKVTLREGLRFWLQGQTVSTDGSKVVKPFRQLKLPGLPGPIKDQYKLHWKPIFSYLEGNGAYEVPRNTQQMTDGEIERIYDQCINFLKENVSYCFQSRRANPTNWALGTWSIKTRRSSILKNGTEEDKAKVVDATNRNRARGPNTRPGRQNATNPLYRYRQRSRVERLIRNNQQQETKEDDEDAFGNRNNQQQETKEDDEDVFGNVFHNAELSEAARARLEEIRQEVDAELRVEVQEQQEIRNRVGDAVGEDGNWLWHRGTGGEAPIPGTQAHDAWLRLHVVNSLPP
jgi:hypothetical protein